MIEGQGNAGTGAQGPDRDESFYGPTRVCRLTWIALVLALGSIEVPILGPLAMVLGIIGMIQVNRSGGRLTGHNPAKAAIVVAILVACFFGLAESLVKVGALPAGMICGTNLSGLGKAMLLYANDYQDRLPQAGARTNTWVPALANWAAKDRAEAFGIDPNLGTGRTTLTSYLYLLVRYSEVQPKQFVCNNDITAREFSLNRASGTKTPGLALTEVWDFGPSNTALYCSYSYHHPFGGRALTASSDPSMAIAADRNPYVDGDPSKASARLSEFRAGISVRSSDQVVDKDPNRVLRANSDIHQGEGQQVLFMDGHVNFEKRAYCGVDNDNIYTAWSSPMPSVLDRVVGLAPKAYDLSVAPGGAKDSVLVNDRRDAATVPARTWRWLRRW